ncbi:aldehyde dehydrogenase family protein [Polaromonas sp. C04]|uniref:aldehyde dehydrogenase family protein n=1 Tax=Polaromonas sp. C04 TaxID=1945857 RepID=UPI000986F042|nr:aldehyde dehydrogenase family protein [Polaromonas sp. C04]
MEEKAEGTRPLEVVSPIDGSVVRTLRQATLADVEQAVSTAVAAQKAWAAYAPERRSEALWKLGTLLEQHAEEVARLDVRCTGKVLRDAIAETRRAARHARYWAGMADKLYGQQLADVPGRLSYSKREPLGAYAVVLPWNAPAHGFMARTMPPLACGNAVVVKPSELSPLSALRIAELALEAGIPRGVLQVLVGDGVVGGMLTSHRDIAGVSFTGSPGTGRRILMAAIDTFKKVTLELGGKSPIVVFPDADLDSAARAAVIGIVTNAGQICAASSRLLVHHDIADRFIDDVARRLERVVVGDPFDEMTQVGPIVCRRQYDAVNAYIRSGVEEGARLVAGGGRPRGLEDGPGLYVAPTLLDASEGALRITREEVFGPVLAVSRFGSEEEAVRMANDADYGLAAFVWTTGAARLIRMTDAIDAGVVHGNTTLVMDSGLPFGGFKASGLGGAFGSDAVEGCTRTKRVTIRTAAGPLASPWPGI